MGGEGEGAGRRSGSHRPHSPSMSTCCYLRLDRFFSHTFLAANAVYFTEQLEAWLGRGAISAWTSPQFQTKAMHLLGQKLKSQNNFEQNMKLINHITCFQYRHIYVNLDLNLGRHTSIGKAVYKYC